MSETANMRVFRGDAESGDWQDYSVEVEEGQVVLDVIHRIQATQAPDLAVRWNCKAGKCGSCSAEINGEPRLMCMTRMNLFEPGEQITVAPMKTWPLIRDLVTDVSFNYEVAKNIPAFKPRPSEADGTYRMMQEDIERGQEFRKCIECFLCQNVCHVIRDHPENKPEFAGPRFFVRLAELEMHPPRHRGSARARPQGRGRGLLQHHQVLHRGLSGRDPHHGQRHHPPEGARRRPLLRPHPLARLQALRPGLAERFYRHDHDLAGSECVGDPYAWPPWGRLLLVRVGSRLACPVPAEWVLSQGPLNREESLGEGWGLLLEPPRLFPCLGCAGNGRSTHRGARYARPLPCRPTPEVQAWLAA